MVDRPRTLEEIVADMDPAQLACIKRIEAFVKDQAEVNLAEDRVQPGDWRVEYFDSDGGCYVTIFAGPRAEQRARAYFLAFKSEQLKIICEDGRNGGG